MPGGTIGVDMGPRRRDNLARGIGLLRGHGRGERDSFLDARAELPIRNATRSRPSAVRIASESELRPTSGERTIPRDCTNPGEKVMLLLRSRLLFAATVFGVAVVAQAQDSPQRKELRRVDLSGAAGMEVISSISEFRPGEELPRHLHHGVEAGYVVQGAMVQNPGQPPTMLATGAPILNLRDVVHGGFKVVGPGNVILFTVHTVDKGKPLYDWVK
jgi:quercetin dioxygenase-like cupin family protein